jgi:branched-subunit amino acid transport protein
MPDIIDYSIQPLILINEILAISLLLFFELKDPDIVDFFFIKHLSFVPVGIMMNLIDQKLKSPEK